MSQWAIAFATALMGALLLTPLVRLAAWRLGVLDRSDGRRKLHPAPVPLLGGVALFLAVALAAVCGSARGMVEVAWPLPFPLALLLSGGMICFVGCLDDLLGLRVRWKLLGQVAATLPLVLSGHGLERLEFGGWTIELGVWGGMLTVGWLVTGANALNFLDGIDGLASSLGITIAGASMLIAQRLGHAEAGVLAAALGGGLAGFLFYNWQPATIFLGDAGSMLIGLWLAAVAAEGTATPAVGTRLVVLVGLVSVPLADIALAVLRRTLSGRRFWIADRGHVHHCLLDQGWSVSQSVELLSAVCLATGGLAYAAAVHGRELLTWGAFGALFIVLARLRWFGHHEIVLTAQVLARAVLNLSARLSLTRSMRGLPSAAELEHLRAGSVWARFVSEMELHQVEHVDIAAGAGGRPDARHDWGPAQEPCPEAWLLEIHCEAPRSEN